MKFIFTFILSLCSTLYGASASCEESRTLIDTTNIDTYQKDTINVVSIDWTQTETLLALGIEPIAVAKKAGYNSWVREPKIPDHIPDLGLRTQPNLELISELKPDKILLSPMFQYLEPMLSRIAPISNIALYKTGNLSWESIKEATYSIANETNSKQAADELITSAENRFVELSKQLPNDTPPLLMIQFMDSQHVRVFGNNSMYKVAANKIGLQNAWKEKTNNWGFSLIGIDKLIGLEGQILVVKPYPAGAEARLRNNQFWQHIIKESNHPLLEVEPVWSFGAIPASVRFANLITNKLSKESK